MSAVDWLFDRPAAAPSAPPIIAALEGELMEGESTRSHALHLQATVEKVLAAGERRGEPWVNLQGKRLREMADRWAARHKLPPMRRRARSPLWDDVPAVREAEAIRSSPEPSSVDQFLARHGVGRDQRPFDPGRAATTIAFQRRHGLRADGVIGPKTAAVLHDQREAPTRSWRDAAQVRDDFITNTVRGAGGSRT